MALACEHCLSTPPTYPRCKADCRKLKQILDNFIDDAVKFTEHGDIDIMVEVRDDCWPSHPHPDLAPADSLIDLVISDTGIGIPSGRLDHIFEKFFHVDSSETRRYGGVGLGLHTAKKLAGLLGGTIEARSIPRSGLDIHGALTCLR